MRDVSSLKEYLQNLGGDFIPYSDLLKIGWTEQEINVARYSTDSKKDKKHFWAPVFVVALVILASGIVLALPSSLQEWIDSNGTRGSPVFVESGNVTYKGIVLTQNSTYEINGSRSNVSVVYNQTGGSNPPASLNITNKTQNATEAYNLSTSNFTQNMTGNITGAVNSSSVPNVTSVNLTEEQSLLEKKPALEIYVGENKTIYVVDNKQIGDSLNWIIKKIW